MQELVRGAGVLAHITSLPGSQRFGTFGAPSHDFAEWCAGAGLRYWQILPLGTVGYGYSPYSALSAFALDPALVGIDVLPEELLPAVQEMVYAATDRAGHHAFIAEGLHRAYDAFCELSRTAPLRREYRTFCDAEAEWLDDYALFAALKEENGGIAWWEWPLPHRMPSAKEKKALRSRLSRAVELQCFMQFIARRQWDAVKEKANSLGVNIIGDVPIFVARDSADAWGNGDLFRLLPDGTPEVVAGVPPDYFSPDGQLWGNPHYRWAAMRSDGFRWWVRRIEHQTRLCDVVRIDHFRGFSAAWEVDGSADTAREGRWAEAPGEELFTAIRTALPRAPIIAEDLGVITPEVEALRDRFGFPGMRILQFGFESRNPANAFLPHNYISNTVVYTGTHDNDTSLGWYRSVSPEVKEFFAEITEARSEAAALNAMVVCALASVASLAIVPLQDLLAQGSSARMNTPGKADGNWMYRAAMLPPRPVQERIARLVTLYNR